MNYYTYHVTHTLFRLNDQEFTWNDKKDTAMT